jgi:hypothetical protein
MENTNNDVTTVVDATNNLGFGADQKSFAGTVQGASFQSNGGVTDVVNSQNPSGAYDFDGVDDFVDIGNIPSIENESAISFGGWADLSTVSSDREVIGSFKSNVFDNGIAILQKGPDIIRADVRTNGKTNNVQADVSLQSGLTHYFARFDSGSLDFFVNGQLQVSATGGPSQTPQVPITLMTRFQNKFVAGITDDVRFYNRFVSASEINQIYNNTKP